MTENQLELEVKNFRAIQEAKIALNGITVISGENGCGKSTLSKLTYHSMQMINQYEDIMLLPLLSYLKKVNDTFTDIANDLLSLASLSKSIKKLEAKFYTKENIPDIIGTIQTGAQSLKDAHQAASELSDTDKALSRLKNILLSLIKDNEDKEWNQIIDDIIQFIENQKKETESAISNRNIEQFLLSVSQSFNNENLFDKFNLYEYGVYVTDKKNGKLLNFNTINKVLYIDTPMAVGLTSTEIQHWNYLNEILRSNTNLSTNTCHAYHYITDDILKGEATYNKQPLFGRFIYKREDGLTVNLMDCATGIKSFAILQILVRNSFLDDKTLLIIDEPEAHLHPQWIVEYARVITFLNKELGVKFLMASHNPDMISAIKYISEKEQTSSHLNFYLAEQKENNTYKYKGLGVEIDEIFGSFNIAIDRINQYGDIENEIF